MEVTQKELTRQEALKVWLRRNNLTSAAIAQALDVSEAAVSRLFFKVETIPTLRHFQLLQLGIPKELLPEAKDITPGPKRKKIKCPEVGIQGKNQ